MLEAGEQLGTWIEGGDAVLGVVGLGGIGLPLAVEMGRSGYRTPGFDVSELNPICRSIKGSRGPVLGVASDREADDLRESPTLEIIYLLQKRGVEVRYHVLQCPVSADDGDTPIRSLPADSVMLTDAELHDAGRVAVDARGVRPAEQGEAQVIGLSRLPRTEDSWDIASLTEMLK